MRMVDLAHSKIAPFVMRGDICVDATAGNGHDTLFLAKRVFPTGSVFAVDLQSRSISTTKQRILDHNVQDVLQARVHCHSKPKDWLPQRFRGQVAAAMYNLGYLPGADHNLATRPETTLKSLGNLYPWIRKGGAISILCYRGHDGGIEETEEIDRYCKEKKWKVEKTLASGNPASPVLFFVQRL